MHYTIQGVPLTDNRWENPGAKFHTWRDGVWELLNGTELLPRLPGQKVTEFEYPGQEGESQVQYAPGRGRLTPLRLRFWAIEFDPQSPGFQRMPPDRDVPDRVRVLQANVEEFLFRAQVARSASEGFVELERRFGQDGRTMRAAGRIGASVEPEYGPGYQYADYTFPFTNPTGTWYGEWSFLSANGLAAGSTTAVQVPMGNAPVLDAKVAIRTTGATIIPAGTTVTNALGVGFAWGRDLASGGHWRLVDCGRRAYSGTQTGYEDMPNWNPPLNNPTMIHSVGRPQGGFLRITPGVPGSYVRAGRVFVKPTVGVDFRIAVRPRFY